MNWSSEELDKQCEDNKDLAVANGINLKPNVTSAFSDVVKGIGGKIPYAIKPNSPVANAGGKQKPVLEKDFATAFDDLATLRGWTWCGFRPARQKIDGEEQYRTPVIGQKGLPDRILARGGIVLLVELKTDIGRLSDGQKIWAEALKGYGYYFVLRPSDWYFIEGLLS
jgi:hypothetical protein